jgi:hypothetical protein
VTWLHQNLGKSVSRGSYLDIKDILYTMVLSLIHIICLRWTYVDTMFLDAFTLAINKYGSEEYKNLYKFI